ncbi:MAG: D-inositol-3-phosphate glycosyltransferase [Chthoniobacter sp.]|jgi:glycosyltransferase involved in cell wall biosynthesis|nr:D-inositol-3-phosphate glycosyltransferase [Chthoniobacter sp.]
MCSGLAGLGHEVAVLGGYAASPRRWHGFTGYPGDGRNPDPKVLLGYLRKLRPDVLISLMVPEEGCAIIEPRIEAFRRSARIPWILYYPIDCSLQEGGLPEGTAACLQRADATVVMSRFGQEVARASGISSLRIPVGVDLGVFRPVEDKLAAKRALGYGRRFVVLSDARNEIRKLWPRTLEIFRRFAAGKDDVLLHLHCDPFDPLAASEDYHYDLLADVKLLGLGGTVRFTKGMSIRRGLSLLRLASLYQAADVHLLTAFGEGFGMPTLQAAAVGVVPLAPDYAANREMLGAHGEAIRVRGFVPNHEGLQCALVEMDDAAARLERLYRERNLLVEKGLAGRRFAEAFGWPSIVRQWHEMLEEEVPHLCAKIVRRTNGNRSVAPPAEVNGDRVACGNRFTMPVTLPSADPSLLRLRVTGRVCLAGAADRPVFQDLRRVFPRLTAWSPSKLKRPFVCETVPVTSPQFRSYLASSTLALDLGSVNPILPIWAAELAVPLIGLSRNVKQGELWPGLTLARPNLFAATRKARTMLTDQMEAAEACALASRQLGVRATELARLSRQVELVSRKR